MLYDKGSKSFVVEWMLLEGFPYNRKMLKKCKTSIELYDKGSKSFVVEWMLLEGFPYNRKMLKKM